MKRILTFGSFDPLHEGHKNLLAQAKQHGDWLTVVVTRDQVIRRAKGHEPYESEQARCISVAEAGADEVILGDTEPGKYALLEKLRFDVLVLGYDQPPTDAEVRQLLQRVGKSQVAVVRLEPFRPEKYKSSIIKAQKELHE